MSDYDEPDLYSIHDVYFASTKAQQREIRARTVTTPEWLRWKTLELLVCAGDFDAHDPKSRVLCEELAAAERAISLLTIKVVHDVTRSE